MSHLNAFTAAMAGITLLCGAFGAWRADRRLNSAAAGEESVHRVERRNFVIVVICAAATCLLMLVDRV